MSDFDFEHKLPRGDGMEHSHRCPCGELFMCRGVFKCDGTLALVEPCPRVSCPDCTRAESLRWTKRIKEQPPELRLFDGLGKVKQ